MAEAHAAQGSLDFGAATDAASADRAELERRWTDLVDRRLPAAACPEWPVHLNHCFARILLDDATGGVWYDAIPGRPARRHAPDAVLRAATGRGEDILAGRADLTALNAQSLAWRGRGGPGESVPPPAP